MMHRKRSQELQMPIEDFLLPFGGRLSAENRWGKLSKLMPWDIIEDIYAKKFKSEKSDGPRPLSARIAFGSLHIQASECFTDKKNSREHQREPLSAILSRTARVPSRDAV